MPANSKMVGQAPPYEGLAPVRAKEAQGLTFRLRLVPRIR